MVYALREVADLHTTSQSCDLHRIRPNSWSTYCFCPDPEFVFRFADALPTRAKLLYGTKTFVRAVRANAGKVASGNG